MHTFCIFHDRADLKHARTIASRLEAAGFSCWLADSHSIKGWRNDVETNLRRNECVGAIVIWSNDSLNNSIVLSEATETLRHKKTLLAVLVENLGAPLGLENTPRVDMTGWDGSEADQRLEVVIDKASKISRDHGGSSQQINELTVGKKVLQCPAFVFSVSSFETLTLAGKTA